MFWASELSGLCSGSSQAANQCPHAAFAASGQAGIAATEVSVYIRSLSMLYLGYTGPGLRLLTGPEDIPATLQVGGAGAARWPDSGRQIADVRSRTADLQLFTVHPARRFAAA